MADQIIVVDPQAQARKQLADELAALANDPPDETVPGGRYVQQDGSVKDAHGNVLEDAPDEAEDEGEDEGKGRSKSKKAKK